MDKHVKEEAKMIQKGIKRSRRLRLFAFMFLVVAVILRIYMGVSNVGMMYFAVFSALMIYVIVCALSLFPTDWKSRAFEPAHYDLDNKKEIEKIEDKVQLKLAFGWLNLFIMFLISLGIYFGC